MLYIKNVEKPASSAFREMVLMYWQEIMPKAYEIQTEERRTAYFDERFINREKSTCLQWIMKHDEPIGFLHFDILQKQNRAIIHDFYIQPQARRQGRGREAIALFFSQADDHEVERIDLNVRRDNPNALAFWQSQGFAIAQYQLRLYRDPQTGQAFEGSLSSDF